MTNIKQYFLAEDEKMDLYTTAITKAHGQSHPEVFEVRVLYQQLQAAFQKENDNFETLANIFEQLNLITNHYEIPKDSCPTLAATYQYLEKMHQFLIAVKDN